MGQVEIGREYGKDLYVVDSYNNGISFGKVRGAARAEDLVLSLEESDHSSALRSRYALNTAGNPLHELENHLKRLSNRGELSRSTIVFGVGTDPFLPFDSKFVASMKLLEIFRRYPPKMLVVRTRCQLIVLAMPVLRSLEQRVRVNIGIESCDEKVIRKYLPGLPAIEERLKVIRTLNNFNVPVGIQIGPILPYGDWRADARKFADLIAAHVQKVTLADLSKMAIGARRSPVADRVARLIAEQRDFFWLRKDTGSHLEKALREKGLDVGWGYLEQGHETEQIMLPLRDGTTGRGESTTL